MLGPKQLPVALLEHTPDIEQLNTVLYERLNHLGVEYTAPQWVGSGHIFHITDRVDARMELGQSLACQAVYLIEVKVPGYESARIPRVRIALGKPSSE